MSYQKNDNNNCLYYIFIASSFLVAAEPPRLAASSFQGLGADRDRKTGSPPQESPENQKN